MGLSETTMLNILRRSLSGHGLDSERRRLSRIFSVKYSSGKEENPREGDEVKRRERGNMVNESTEKERSSKMEDETMKKLSKEPGGKPLDEDKGMDVNWRPIAEEKPSTQSSS